MRTSKQNVLWIALFMILVLIVLALCIAFIYSLPISDTFDFYIEFNQSLLSKNQFNFITIDSSETFVPVRPIQIRNRFIQNWKRFYAIFNISTSLLAYAKLILSDFLFLASKVNKYVSIIALPIGGHAPPNNRCLFTL